MNNTNLFNNFNLTNEEIESVFKQLDHFIDINSTIKFKKDEDLKQEIYLKIFLVLSKNRKKFKNIWSFFNIKATIYSRRVKNYSSGMLHIEN